MSVVRDATADDMAAVHALIVELAVFEREPQAVTTTPAQLRAAFIAVQVGLPMTTSIMPYSD